MGIYVLLDALAAFHHRHPAVRPSLEVVNRRQVRERLLAGDADLGVVGRLWDDESVVAEPLLRNRLMCFSAPDRALQGRGRLRAAKGLQGPLLLPEPESGTRETAEAILRSFGRIPSRRCRSPATAPSSARSRAGSA